MRKSLLVAVVSLVGCQFFDTASAQVRVGVITSATGPIALVGIPQKNTIPMLPTKVGDITIDYISRDDAGDPTQSVTEAKKLIAEQNIDALIGPSGSPGALAVLQFAAEATVPMLAPVGTSAVVLPMTEAKKWVFKTTQNDDIVIRAIVKQMVKANVKTVGFITTSDAYGENYAKVFAIATTAANIKIVASERFLRADTSVTAQSLKILVAQPDAVLVVAPGGPSVLPQTTLVDQGYKGQIYQGPGAALNDFLRLGGRKVENTIVAGSLMLVLSQIPDSNPSKKVAISYVDGYEKRYGSKPATFGANVLDAGLLLEHAIPIAANKAKPGTREFRAALREALEQVKEVPGAQGVYNMSPADHSGFDDRGVELLLVKGGEWTLLK